MKVKMEFSLEFDTDTVKPGEVRRAIAVALDDQSVLTGGVPAVRMTYGEGDQQYVAGIGIAGAEIESARISPEVPPGMEVTPNGSVAPKAPPAPPSGETAAPPPAVERDRAGFPWDPRIHAQNKSKTQDGHWKAARNVDKALRAAVEAELRGMSPPPSSTPAAPTPPSTDAAGGSANVPPAPPAPPSGEPPAPPPPGAPAAPNPPAPPAPPANSTPTPPPGLVRVSAENAMEMLSNALGEGRLGFPDLKAYLLPHGYANLVAAKDDPACIESAAHHFRALGMV